MAITDYASLTAEVLAWANAPEIEQSISTLVQMAEADFNDQIRHQKMVRRQTALFTTARFPLPTDWVEAISVKLVSAGSAKIPVQLTYASQENLLATIGDDPASMIPSCYSLVDDEIEIAPAPPVAGVNVEMIYYAAIPGLEAANVNWLLTDKPNLYLYGVLARAGSLLEDQSKVAGWAAWRDQAIETLNTQATRARTSGGPLNRRLQTFG
jgi:hypothetical protein